MVGWIVLIEVLVQLLNSFKAFQFSLPRFLNRRGCFSVGDPDLEGEGLFLRHADKQHADRVGDGQPHLVEDAGRFLFHTPIDSCADYGIACHDKTFLPKPDVATLGYEVKSSHREGGRSKPLAFPLMTLDEGGRER